MRRETSQKWDGLRIFLILGISLIIGTTRPAFAQNWGTVSTTGGISVPGGVFSIPVLLSLETGITIDTLSFGLTVIANGNAITVNSPLSFNKSASIPSPSLIDSSAAPNLIAVAWLSGLSLSEANSLGTVAVAIPAGASSGQTYTIRITGVSATSGGSTNINLASGQDTTLNIVGSIETKKRKGQLTSE